MAASHDEFGIVIEAGHSETLEELRSQMRWWFGASQHQVKIVILAKFDQTRAQIILEKWVGGQALSRQGAMTTRAAARLEQNCDQVINITRNPGITNADPNRFSPTSYTVARGDFRLEFDRLFLRPAGQGEGDVIIYIQDLQRFAVAVWRAVAVAV